MTIKHYKASVTTPEGVEVWSTDDLINARSIDAAVECAKFMTNHLDWWMAIPHDRWEDMARYTSRSSENVLEVKEFHF